MQEMTVDHLKFMLESDIAYVPFSDNSLFKDILCVIVSHTSSEVAEKAFDSLYKDELLLFAKTFNVHLHKKCTKAEVVKAILQELGVKSVKADKKRESVWDRIE